jgi:hypothetical protein
MLVEAFTGLTVSGSSTPAGALVGVNHVVPAHHRQGPALPQPQVGDACAAGSEAGMGVEAGGSQLCAAPCAWSHCAPPGARPGRLRRPGRPGRQGPALLRRVSIGAGGAGTRERRVHRRRASRALSSRPRAPPPGALWAVQPIHAVGCATHPSIHLSSRWGRMHHEAGVQTGLGWRAPPASRTVEQGAAEWTGDRPTQAGKGTGRWMGGQSHALGIRAGRPTAMW